jgi:flagellar hook-length control protein FliK
MVSGRLSLPQSFQASTLSAPSRAPKPSARELTNAQGSPGFAAHLAPDRQEVRPKPRQPSESPGSVSGERSIDASEQRGTKEPNRTEASDAGIDDGSEAGVEAESAATSAEDAAADQVAESGAKSESREQTGETEGDSSKSEKGDKPEGVAADAKNPGATVPNQPVNDAPVAESDQNIKLSGDPKQGAEAPVEVVASTKVHGRSVESGTQESSLKADTSRSADAKAKEGRAEPGAQVAPAPTKSDQKSTGDSPAPRADGEQKPASEPMPTNNADSGEGGDQNGEQGSSRRDNDARGEASSASREQSAPVPIGSNAASQPAAESEPVAEDGLKPRPVQRHTEPARPNAEPVTARADAATQEVPQPLKAPQASVAERIAGGNTQISDRPSVQAVREGEAPTNQAVARGMNAVLRQGGGALTMKLSPASLGEVRIEMTMQNGRVSVQFDVGNVAAYQAIKGQLTELRQSLEQRGMTVERVETHVSPALARSAQAESNANNNRGGEQSTQQGQHDRHDAAGEQSRGRADAENHQQRGGEWSQHASDEFDSDFEQSLRLGLDAVA